MGHFICSTITATYVFKKLNVIGNELSYVSSSSMRYPSLVKEMPLGSLFITIQVILWIKIILILSCLSCYRQDRLRTTLSVELLRLLMFSKN